MPFRLWTLDVAREQCFGPGHLEQFATVTLDSGYDGLGLYLEHRFAFPSAPWAAGAGALTPDAVAGLRSRFPNLRIVPFLNLLGHMEGWLHTAVGRSLRPGPLGATEGDPDQEGLERLCHGLLEDALAVFDSETVHLGGDETSAGLAKTGRYVRHFQSLIEKCLREGRRPAVWGDVALAHPEVLGALDRRTLIFDWQYFGGVSESARVLRSKGHEVVACPTIHVYDAAWCHVPESEDNVRRVAADAARLGLAGVCLTTWESGLFGAYDTVVPLVRAAAALIDDPEGAPGLLQGMGPAEEWARLMGVVLNQVGGTFAFDGHRSRLKGRFLLGSDPFLLAHHHGEELAGPVGDAALDVCEKALEAAPGEAEQGVTLFVRGAVEFARMAVKAGRAYEDGRSEEAVAILAPSRHVFDTLETVAKRSHVRCGGSLADVERCRRAREHVETVIKRIRAYGSGELGYLPSFDVLTSHRFTPHDQACWWAVNRWALD